MARIQGAELCTIELDGVKWRFWRAGSGPVLLLIHGLMGYSFSWRFNVAKLSENFTVYAFDLPSCGFSERSPRQSGSLEYDAVSVLRFMDELGIEEAGVIGSSRGGGLSIVLGALLAERHMLDRLRRLILVSPINPWSPYGRYRTRLLATPLGGLYVRYLHPRLTALQISFFLKLYGDPARIAPGSMEGYGAGLQPPGSYEHIGKIMRWWHRDLQAIANSLPAITDVPTLLLWGTKDRAVPLLSVDPLHDRLPNSTVLLMDGAGHMPYEEIPDEFNRVVCDFFLRRQPATPYERAGTEKRPVASIVRLLNSGTEPPARLGQR